MSFKSLQVTHEEEDSALVEEFGAHVVANVHMLDGGEHVI